MLRPTLPLNPNLQRMVQQPAVPNGQLSTTTVELMTGDTMLGGDKIVKPQTLGARGHLPRGYIVSFETIRPHFTQQVHAGYFLKLPIDLPSERAQ